MRIQTCFIPPLNHLELALEGSILFALAQYIDKGNQEYINFFRSHSKDRYIIMDSGVAEGTPIPHDRLIACASKIQASEIVCPDTLFNSTKTVRDTKNFLSSLSRREKKMFLFQAVPQATNVEDYLDCFKALQSLPEVTCIGISKFDAPRIFGSSTDFHAVSTGRRRCIQLLKQRELIEKPIHCLGCDDPKEFAYYRAKGWTFVRSCDSAAAILYALHDIHLSAAPYYWTPLKPKGGSAYFKQQLNKEQLQMAKANMKVVRRLCGDTDD